MTLVVNGEKYCQITPIGLKMLLVKLKVDRRRAAVLVNDEVIPRARQAKYVLKNGDRVEILTLALGG